MKLSKISERYIDELVYEAGSLEVAKDRSTSYAPADESALEECVGRVKRRIARLERDAKELRKIKKGQS